MSFLKIKFILAIIYAFVNCNIALAENSISGSLSCVFSGRIPVKKVSSSQITVITNDLITNADVDIQFERLLKNKKQDVQGSISAFFEAVEGSPPVAAGETISLKTTDFKFEISVRANNSGKTFKITNQLPDGTFAEGKAVTEISTFDGMNLSGVIRFVLPRTLKELNVQEGGVFSVKQVENGRITAKCIFKDLELMSGLVIPNG